MQTEGMIADMVRNLQSDSATLRMLCARAIFRLAEEEETRDLVRYNGGLDPLVEMLSDNTNQDDMVTIYLKCRFIQFNRYSKYLYRQAIETSRNFSYSTIFRS